MVGKRGRRQKKRRNLGISINLSCVCWPESERAEGLVPLKPLKNQLFSLEDSWLSVLGKDTKESWRHRFMNRERVRQGSNIGGMGAKAFSSLGVQALSTPLGAEASAPFAFWCWLLVKFRKNYSEDMLNLHIHMNRYKNQYLSIVLQSYKSWNLTLQS